MLFFPRYILNKSNKMVLWNVWKREWEKHIHFDYYKRYLSSTTISSLWIFLHLTSSHWLHWWLHRERKTELKEMRQNSREKERIRENASVKLNQNASQTWNRFHHQKHAFQPPIENQFNEIVCSVINGLSFNTVCNFWRISSLSLTRIYKRIFGFQSDSIVIYFIRNLQWNCDDWIEALNKNR